MFEDEADIEAEPAIAEAVAVDIAVAVVVVVDVAVDVDVDLKSGVRVWQGGPFALPDSNTAKRERGRLGRAAHPRAASK